MRRLLLCGVLIAGVIPAFAQPATFSIGSALPVHDHTVKHVGGEAAAVSSLMGEHGTVLIFWSNSCQWTVGYEERVIKLHETASAQGVALVLVNSNDAGAFPEEAPAQSATKQYPVPYVHDPGAVLAAALGAFRTPEVFAFGADGTLAYSGAIDDAPGDAKSVQEAYVAKFLAGQPGDATKAFGCRIRFPGG